MIRAIGTTVLLELAALLLLFIELIRSLRGGGARG